MSAIVAFATLLTRAASSDVLFTDHVEVTDHDEVGLLQLHRDTSSIAKAGKRQEPWNNPCVQDPYIAGPDDTFFDGAIGNDLPISNDDPNSFYQQNRFCWRIDTDQEGWNHDVTPREKVTWPQAPQYVRGGEHVQWTITASGMVERPGDAPVVKRTDCYYPWHDRHEPVKNRRFALPGMDWCSEKGRYCTQGITVRGITTEYLDGAFAIEADGVFSFWAGGCDGGENWITHLNRTRRIDDCRDFCRRQNKNSETSTDEEGCWIACNCVHLPDLDPCTITGNSGKCEDYDAVAITDGEQCLDAAEALRLPVSNPASRAIYPSEAYWGCLYGENITDTKAVTGQNLWYGGSKSRDGREPIPAGFRQLCTPRVAKIAGGCSGSSDGSWKPIIDPDACAKAGNLMGITDPVSGVDCHVDSSRAEELCTKD